MKNMNFGAQNELERHTQEELARDASIADWYVVAVCALILIGYVLAGFLGFPE